MPKIARQRLLRGGVGLLILSYGVSVLLVALHGFPRVTHRRVTVRLVHWQTEGSVRAGIDAVIAQYERLNPDVEIIQMVVPGSMYTQWLEAQLVGGTAPDIVEYGYWFGRTAELQGRYFQPLDRWLREPNPYNGGTSLAAVKWRDTFLDGLDNPNCYNPQMDECFGVSLCTDTLRLFYNRPLLQRITGADRPPRSFREFLELCTQIRAYARKYQPKLVPVSGSKDTVSRMSDTMLAATTMKLAYGLDRLHRLRLDSTAAALAYLRGDWHYQDASVLAGLQLAQAYCRQLDPGALQLERDSATGKFANGDAVMFASGTFDASSLRLLCPFAVGACRIPVPERDDPVYGRFIPGRFADGQVGTTFAFYLLRRSPARTQALDFMRFMTSQPGVQLFADTSNWLPGVVGVKPTTFSRQYLPDHDGYGGPGASFSLLSGPEAFGLFNQEIFELVGPQGGPEKFAAAMAKNLRGRIIADLNRSIREAIQNQNQEDVILAARHFERAAAGETPHTPVSSANLAEAVTYRYRRDLVYSESQEH